MDYKKKYFDLLDELEQLIEKHIEPIGKSKVDELKEKAATLGFNDLEKRGE